jgi:signal peptidase I
MASRRALVAAAIAAVGATALLRAFVLLPVTVESASMTPTLRAGDVVLSTRMAPDADDLERGDLVAFRSPEDGERAVKRVIGLPGEEIVVLDGELHVDGGVVAESYVDPAGVDGYYSRTFVVPDGTVFVMGDNRGNSIDSRDYGAVPGNALEGRVVVRLWPWG